MFSGPSFRLFSLLGFRIGAHWSFPLALVFAGIAYGGVGGVALSLLLFASVLAHELGHAVVARRRGVGIVGIDLHFFGGVAKMANPPRSLNDEIAIAAAGPIVSLALAALFFGLAVVVPAAFVAWLAGANLMLGVFNLVPALPLDGGRVLRALLAKRRGLVDGTRIAVTVSRASAVVLAVIGILWAPWLLALALLVWLMGNAELEQIAQHHFLRRRGFWHPAHVPWARYEDAAQPVAADDAFTPSGPRPDRTWGRRTLLEPDVVIIPPGG
jgi:Zn-dependent protease